MMLYVCIRQTTLKPNLAAQNLFRIIWICQIYDNNVSPVFKYNFDMGRSSSSLLNTIPSHLFITVIFLLAVFFLPMCYNMSQQLYMAIFRISVILFNIFNTLYKSRINFRDHSTSPPLTILETYLRVPDIMKPKNSNLLCFVSYFYQFTMYPKYE